MPVTSPMEPVREGLDWLGRTSLDALPGEVRRRLEESYTRGVEDGYRRGYDAGGLAVEQAIRQEAEERVAAILAKQPEVEAAGYRRGYDVARVEVEERLHQEAVERVRQAEARGYRSGQEEAEGRLAAEQEEAARRLHAEIEHERQAWHAYKAEAERQQAEANLKEAEERMLAFERMMRDREKSIEERLRKELAAEQGPRPLAASPGPSKAALEEAYQRGVREASVVKAANDNGKLDAARKQAYQSGFEHGVAKAKRDLDGASRTQLDDARRQGYMEGLAEGRRGSLGIEGSRSWALGIMHLPDEATPDEVRQRFRKLSKLFHPDQNPELGDAFIKNLQRARDILGD